ncbi:MAG TPA: flagellar biosynthetic protein FliO [Pusillimonas sp.]|uniref:flagellar biosynthetic protein FliO n=1 Tax=unclassified Pusillimonas TaxID=2640016 RepID=UPI00262E396D|nr:MULTISPECIES: flagellar biosynthetic protein FliO [unclassified Pusillimonas]HLU18551.1 flagellar biosynthetic protein FliO [Pusillimonas sp.]
MAEADALRMVASLAFIVFIILAGAWLLRRTGLLRAGGGQAVKIVGAQSLGARSSIVVVQVEDAQLVVGVTPQQITLLHTMPPGQLTTGPESVSDLPRQPNFSQALRAALSGPRKSRTSMQP